LHRGAMQNHHRDQKPQVISILIQIFASAFASLAEPRNQAKICSH
jgi:hypothetical protein